MQFPVSNYSKRETNKQTNSFEKGPFSLWLKPSTRAWRVRLSLPGPVNPAAPYTTIEQFHKG